MLTALRNYGSFRKHITDKINSVLGEIKQIDNHKKKMSKSTRARFIESYKCIEGLNNIFKE